MAEARSGRRAKGDVGGGPGERLPPRAAAVRSSTVHNHREWRARSRTGARAKSAAAQARPGRGSEPGRMREPAPSATMSGRPQAQLFDQASSATPNMIAQRAAYDERDAGDGPPLSARAAIGPHGRAHRSIPAGGVGAPNASPIQRGFLVQHRRGLSASARCCWPRESAGIADRRRRCR